MTRIKKEKGLPMACPNCGQPTIEGAKFCASCGSPLIQTTAAAPQAPAAAESDDGTMLSSAPHMAPAPQMPTAAVPLPNSAAPAAPQTTVPQPTTPQPAAQAQPTAQAQATPDYDDWNLNCDIFFWDETLNRALEVSSMGIRVDAESLDRQLTLAHCDDRRTLPFHRMLLNNELPLTIGGGIGQSRLSMLLLDKAHIGEVQVSLWDETTRRICEEAGVKLL